MANDDHAGPTARRHTSLGGWLVQSRASRGPATWRRGSGPGTAATRAASAQSAAGGYGGAGASAVAAAVLSTSPGLTWARASARRFFRRKGRWLRLGPAEVHDRQEVAAHAADAKEGCAQPQGQGDGAEGHEPWLVRAVVRRRPARRADRPGSRSPSRASAARDTGGCCRPGARPRRPRSRPDRGSGRPARGEGETTCNKRLTCLWRGPGMGYKTWAIRRMTGRSS